MNNISSNNQSVSSLNLSANSWHARVYKYIFHKQVYIYKKGLPNNLCLYFWKTLMAVFLYVILFVYSFPIFVLNIIIGSVVSIFKPGNFSFKLAPNAEDCFGMVTGIYMLLFVASFVVYEEYLFYLIVTTGMPNPTQFEGTMGFIAIILNFCICGFLIYQLANWIYLQIRLKVEKREERKELESEKHSSFGKMALMFIKAKIGKYCPKINWK